MKNRKFWRILLGVVVAVVVLGTVGFGFYRRSMWGGRFVAWGKMSHDSGGMSHDYDGDMPCGEDAETSCEGYGLMPCGQFRGYGMGRMSHMRGGAGMHGRWGHHGSSPLTHLLLLVLIVMGVLHFTRYHRYHKYWHHGHHVDSSCCCGEEHEHGNTAPVSDTDNTVDA